MDIEYLKKTFHFSETSTTPLYIQLVSYFRLQIQTGELRPGDQMIPETVLSEALKVSRTTIRQAMNYLVSEGLLTRRRGKGTFISNPKLKRNINYLYDFTENILSIGAVPSSIVLVSERLDITPEPIRSVLQLKAPDLRTFHLERLRCANQEPILIERTYIPYFLCEGIEQYDFSQQSLYRVLTDKYALQHYHASETIEADLISKEESVLLHCSSRSACYHITRVSKLDTGLIYEYTDSTTRADKCVFHLELYKKQNHNVPFKIQRTLSV